MNREHIQEPSSSSSDTLTHQHNRLRSLPPTNKSSIPYSPYFLIIFLDSRGVHQGSTKMKYRVSCPLPHKQKHERKRKNWQLWSTSWLNTGHFDKAMKLEKPQISEVEVPFQHWWYNCQTGSDGRRATTLFHDITVWTSNVSSAISGGSSPPKKREMVEPNKYYYYCTHMASGAYKIVTECQSCARLAAQTTYRRKLPLILLPKPKSSERLICWGPFQRRWMGINPYLKYPTITRSPREWFQLQEVELFTFWPTFMHCKILSYLLTHTRLQSLQKFINALWTFVRFQKLIRTDTYLQTREQVKYYSWRSRQDSHTI